MKVTSLKDVETYIYSSVILPLKSLDADPLDFPSPIRGENGANWLLSTRQEPLERTYRRNYQRTQAQRKAEWQIILYNGRTEYVIGSYNTKTHFVKLYERPFRKLAAMPLLGKLYSAFYRNTPFTKVITEMEAPKPKVVRERPMRLRGDALVQPTVMSNDWSEDTPF